MENMQGIIFDLGHTLMEFQGEWEAVEKAGSQEMLAFLHKHGVSVPHEFAEYFVKKRNEEAKKSDTTAVEYKAEEAFFETAEKFILNGKIKALAPQALEAYFKPEEAHWTPYPDALDLLKTLKKEGFRLGIVSNATDHSFILRCVRKFGFEAYFDPILSSAAFHSRKPHPQIFWSVANRWGMPYSNVVVVGDQLYYDIFGAHQAGMKGIWLDRNSPKAYTFIPEKLKTDPRLVPDAVAHTLSEIPQLLQKIF
jgi:putative hydrolase of the HAD superfamily